jgi:hypothetical protein
MTNELDNISRKQAEEPDQLFTIKEEDAIIEKEKADPKNAGERRITGAWYIYNQPEFQPSTKDETREQAAEKELMKALQLFKEAKMPLDKLPRTAKSLAQTLNLDLRELYQ